MTTKKIYAIGGPTAGGKSQAALTLAHQKKGIVINADSMQVYADLKILSARPDSEQTEGVPHFLYGYLNAWQHCNMMDWLLKATEILNEYPVCIVVGGTGLYLDALINGVNDIPDVDPIVRNQVRHMPIEEVKSLVKECKAVDDQRLRRALEVQLSTGKTLSFFQKLPRRQLIQADFETIFVAPPRDILYQQCNNRFVEMLELGAEEEVRSLMRLQPTGGVLKAIGVSEINAYHNGLITREEMIERAQRATRQYAKRQITWFRHRFNGGRIIKSADELN